MVDANSNLILIFIIFLIWIPQATYQVLVWAYWLQVKEYRFDRFWVFLRTPDGADKLYLKSIFLKFLGITLVLIFPYLLFLPGLVIFLFVYQDVLFLIDLIKSNIKKPIVTERAEKILTTCSVGIITTLIIGFLSSFTIF